MKLAVSCSGGKTSMKMAHDIKKNVGFDYSSAFEEIVYAIANTGKEHLETLTFADRCDREWGLGLIWVEAVVHEDGVACTHKIVTFATAARNGEPFELVIQKYGIPNKAYPHCTRELKLNPLKSYIASLGWKPDEYLWAVGMRADEPLRVQPKPGIFYPFAEITLTTKPMVNDWWDEQPFTLPIKEREGNCDNCWKKSDRKLIQNVHSNRESFEWWSAMETRYGLAGYNEDGTPRVFFRGNRSARQLIAIAELVGPQVERLPLFPDENGGCSESCEAFG